MYRYKGYTDDAKFNEFDNAFGYISLNKRWLNKCSRSKKLSNRI